MNQRECKDSICPTLCVPPCVCVCVCVYINEYMEEYLPKYDACNLGVMGLSGEFDLFPYIFLCCLNFHNIYDYTISIIRIKHSKLFFIVK